jgi:hypothetical protein
MGQSLTVVLLLLASIAPALGQSQKNLPSDTQKLLASRVGTIATSATPQFADGQLYGCIIEYTVLAQDYAYRSGGIIKVGGSFGLITTNQNIVVSLKVIVHDIDTAKLQTTYSVPDSAYFISGTRSSKPFLLGKNPSDTPGGLLVLFNVDGSFETVMDALDRQTLTITFNRKPGGVDLQIPIDLTVEETNEAGEKKRSNKAATEFRSCVGELIQSERAKANK